MTTDAGTTFYDHRDAYVNAANITTSGRLDPLDVRLRRVRGRDLGDVLRWEPADERDALRFAVARSGELAI